MWPSVLVLTLLLLAHVAVLSVGVDLAAVFVVTVGCWRRCCCCLAFGVVVAVVSLSPSMALL